MAKPHLNLDESHLDDFLNEPNIEANTPNISVLMPPLPCRMTITLDDVTAYDRNPRRKRNPNYKSIKESIRNRGLDDEPTITRRSVEEPFMIRSGGNTRLSILAELYQEYSEKALEAEEAGELEQAQAHRLKAEEFYRFEWTYKPWTGEINALVGHMAENEERGDMIYIEKALAIKDLQEMFSAESEKPLSARKLASKITEFGWSISHNSVTLMQYVASELDGKIDKALWAGLGSPQISKLRALHRAYGKFCHTQGISAESFTEKWQESLTICDDEELNIDSIRRYADQLISDELNIDYFTVTAEIDAILAGNKPILKDKTQNPLQDDPSEALHPEQPEAMNTDNVINLDQSQSRDPASASNDSSNTAVQTNKTLDSSHAPITLDKLNELRQQVYVDVVLLGMPFELAHYVNKSQSGLGFFIDPVQEAEFETQADVVNDLSQTSRNAIWLYLKQLSLHNLFMSDEPMVPVEQAVSGSNLTPDVFFTLNSHFHLMRLTDQNIQTGINKIEQSINALLQAADEFYGENALHQLFK